MCRRPDDQPRDEEPRRRGHRTIGDDDGRTKRWWEWGFVALPTALLTILACGSGGGNGGKGGARNERRMTIWTRNDPVDKGDGAGLPMGGTVMCGGDRKEPGSDVPPGDLDGYSRSLFDAMGIGKRDRRDRDRRRFGIVPVLSALVTLVVACSSGDATPKDRQKMYGWNQATNRDRARNRRQPGEGRRSRPPGRGSIWGSLPKPKNDEGNRRDKPWSWLARFPVVREVRG